MSTLILMRHGQSLWNQANLFTGWVDIPLSQKGIEESLAGGVKIQKEPIDCVFTSTLIRAQMTAVLALSLHESKKIPRMRHPQEEPANEMEKIYNSHTESMTLPMLAAWQLNERMYGQLQGLNKQEVAKKYGNEQVQLWRRSFDCAPPGGESLQMTAARVLPYFDREILPKLNQSANVLIVAHGNSLRAIVMQLEHLSKQAVMSLEIATGEPIIYNYDHRSFTRRPL